MSRPRTGLLILGYAGILGYGVFLRLPGMNPVSFGNDDCWLAIAIRDMSWREFLGIRPPIPIGFRFAAFPASIPVLAIGVGVVMGLVTLWGRRSGRAFVALVGGIFASLLVASALELYPAGAMRLSAFHRPLIPVIFAVGVHRLLRSAPPRARVIALVVATLAALPFAERSRYARTGGAGAARTVYESVRPDDTVVTFLRSAHPLGYYFPGPRVIVPEPRLGAAFVARLRLPQAHYLWLGRRHALESESELDRHVAGVLDAATDRIVFVRPLSGGARIRARSDHVLSRLLSAGYRRTKEKAPSSFIVVLERSGARPGPRALGRRSGDTLGAVDPTGEPAAPPGSDGTPAGVERVIHRATSPQTAAIRRRYMAA